MVQESYNNISKDTNDTLLTHDTYFTLVIDYLSIKLMFSSVVLISKYHFNYINDNDNKTIFQRLISSQIGNIFSLSKSFKHYYFQSNTNPYKIIPCFYTDFGIIQQNAFPEHHKKIITLCNEWQADDSSVDWQNAEIINDEEYSNPFDFQYNAIKYTKIPFDFVMLWKLQNSEFVIFWLKYVMKQNSINCLSDLSNIFLNEPPYYTDILNWRYEIVLITAISNFDTFSGGYPFFNFLIRSMCLWPHEEFKKIIDFVLLNVSKVLVRNFLCYELEKFCKVSNKEIGYKNYCYYLTQCLKHKSVTSSEFKKVNELTFQRHLYRSILDIILRENSATENGILQINKYHRLIFMKVGETLKQYVKLCEINFTNIDTRINFTMEPYRNVNADEYYRLFCEFF